MSVPEKHSSQSPTDGRNDPELFAIYVHELTQPRVLPQARTEVDRIVDCAKRPLHTPNPLEIVSHRPEEKVCLLLVFLDIAIC